MSTAGYLQDAKNQQKRLAETITSKGITATATEKYKDLVDKVTQIENLKGEERTLENFTNVLSEPKSVVQLEYPEPKNLFDINNPTYAARSKANTAFLPTIEDGVISFNTYYSQRGGSGFVIPVEPNTTITISFDSVGSDYWTEIMAVESILDNVAINIDMYPQLKNITKYTLTQRAGKHYILFILDGIDGYYTAKIKNLQIEKGSTATPYEPHTKTLNAKLGSKNLFDVNTTPTFTSTGATYTVSGTTITFKSNNTTNNSFYYSIPVEIGKTYTVSVSSIDWDSTSQGIFLSSIKAADLRDYDVINKTTLSKTFTAITNTLWIHGYLSYPAGDFTFSFDKLQVEEGTTATAYTPYISDFSTVNLTRCGKNLINNAMWDGASPYTHNGVTFTVNADGTVTANGTATGGLAVYYNRTVLKSAANKTFTISGITGGSSTTYKIRVSRKEKAYEDLFDGYKTFTPDGDIEMIILSINEGVTVNNLVFKPQLELGSTATTYELYQSQNYAPTATGEVSGITNLYPTTTLLTDNAGVVFEQVTGEFYKEILPSTDKNGITKVYQPSVDSSIDSNIKPENIKKGITILGVTGTYEPTA